MTRDEMVKLLQDAKSGVEVGVHRGVFSEHLLKNTKMTLYSVDIWLNQSVYDEAIAILGAYKERSILLKMNSLEASKRFEDEHLDFVYIDANHLYESIQQDIACWYPKVKIGGILSGHDFQICGVEKAVTEFGKEFELTTDGDPSWIIIKNGTHPLED